MQQRHRRRHRRGDQRQRTGSKLHFGLLIAVILLPLLLLANLPLLAVVPGALLTAASISVLESSKDDDATAVEIVDPNDAVAMRQLREATWVEGHSRRIG